MVNSGAVPTLPAAPRAIEKGVALKELLNAATVAQLAANISLVYPSFAVHSFCQQATRGLAELALMARGRHIATALRQHLPLPFVEALEILIASMTPALESTAVMGLAGFFYLPHSFFIAEYGLSVGDDATFHAAMRGHYELTQRFTAEFAIRPFLIEQPQLTLQQLRQWLADPNPHVRRLCSEGTRPRLPWGRRIPAFIQDPQPLLPFLEALRDDSSLYVRRSVANHLGDIAKDHPELAFSLAKAWLKSASSDRKWVIRHALRYPAKCGNVTALALRSAAK
ncbi:MAG: DNA alkylation repair protein [Gammaproteobacteria bacterium]|nr:DNA alkylation repair protein [Gammaproteobacteria bacterium]